MMADRRLEGRDQGSVSFDTNLFFSKVFGMTAQVVQSWGPYARGTEAFFVRPSNDSPTGHFHVRYTHLGNRLRDNLDAVGRIPDDDRREIDSAINKTLSVRSGAFEQIQYDSNYNIYWGQTGILRSWQVDESVGVELPEPAERRGELHSKSSNGSRRTSVTARWAWTWATTRASTTRSTWASSSGELRRGLSAVDRRGAQKITDQFSAEYSLERLVPDARPRGREHVDPTSSAPTSSSPRISSCASSTRPIRPSTATTCRPSSCGVTSRRSARFRWPTSVARRPSANGRTRGIHSSSRPPRSSEAVRTPAPRHVAARRPQCLTSSRQVPIEWLRGFLPAPARRDAGVSAGRVWRAPARSPAPIRSGSIACCPCPLGIHDTRGGSGCVLGSRGP